MPISDYLKSLRSRIGTDLLLVPSVSAVIRDGAGRVLLVKHSEGGVWVIPGGGLDPEEQPADAVVRETWEETGLLVEPIRVVGVYGGPACSVTYRNGDQVSYAMTVFECRYQGGEARPDGVETVDARFFEAAALNALALPAWLRMVLPVALDRKADVYFTPPSWRPPS